MVEASKILPAILVALILVSAVQAFQLNALKEKLEGGKVSAAPAATASAGNDDTGGVIASSGSSASEASDISSLPSMVGGC